MRVLFVTSHSLTDSVYAVRKKYAKKKKQKTEEWQQGEQEKQGEERHHFDYVYLLKFSHRVSHGYIITNKTEANASLNFYSPDYLITQYIPVFFVAFQITLEKYSLDSNVDKGTMKA